MKIFLTEMAYERSKTLEKVEGISFTLNDHLVKYYLLKDNHHVSEIYAHLNFLDELILKGYKKLKASDYYKILFEEPWEPFNENILSKKFENYKREFKKEFIINVEDFFNSLKSMYKEICIMLSENDVNILTCLIDIVKKYLS
jgi:hypothetical protein